MPNLTSLLLNSLKNISKIFSELSITSKPFFLSKEFVIVKNQIVAIRGVELVNSIMEKIL
jgi:hypothetical protein